MNELALFAGAGGGLLGTHLLGFTPVCAVEKEPYCREVLLRRQRDGVLPLFPIWDDVRTFDGRPWRGAVDLVSAGFPCQPHSTASRGRRVAKDLLEETLRVIEEVQPQWIFLENVQRSAFKTLPSRTGCPSELGAAHQRQRYWLLAHHDDQDESTEPLHASMAGLREALETNWWSEAPSEFLGMDDGVAHRVERARAIGNGQVPAVVRFVWEGV